MSSQYTWPPLETYIASPSALGFNFSYPESYLASIAWDQNDIDAGNDGHCLSFLAAEEVVKDLPFVHMATRAPLVPFARGDNGDSLFCFDPTNENNICVINLGERHLVARVAGNGGYVAFLNAYRANLDLPPWEPS